MGILIFLILIFPTIYSLNWKIKVDKFYSKFLNVEFTDIKKNNGLYRGSMYTYISDEKNLIYDVQKPSFLRYTGNLHISSIGDNVDYLIIWPKFNDNSYEYAFGFIEKNEKSYPVDYLVSVDRDGNVYDSDEKTIELANKNKDDLFELFDRAETIFNLEFN